MPNGLVVTGIGNRIEWATHNGKGLITGKRKDVTDEAIKAVFQHLQEEHRRNNRGEKSFGYEFEGLGEIHFHPPVPKATARQNNPNVVEAETLKGGTYQ